MIALLPGGLPKDGLLLQLLGLHMGHKELVQVVEINALFIFAMHTGVVKGLHFVVFLIFQELIRQQVIEAIARLHDQC